jgi:hypothetical protein
MQKDDILIDYKVTKDSELPNMKNIMGSIYNYVQNNPVYFSYEPSFVNGVLIFGIVGLKHNHVNLQRMMGANISASGGKLEVMVDRSELG